VKDAEIIAQRLIGQLARSGLHAHPLPVLPLLGQGADDEPDFGLELRVDGEPWHLLVHGREIAPRAADIARFRHLQEAVRVEHPRRIVLIVAPRLLERHRKALRDAGISHADLRGITWLRAPGLLIDVDRRDETDAPRLPDMASAAAPPDVFSDRSSLVIRAIVDRGQQPVRASAISHATGISNAWVSSVAGELMRRDYVARTSAGLVLADGAKLLMDWMQVYDWRKNVVRRYQIDASRGEILERLPRAQHAENEPAPAYFLTLHAGAALYARHVESDVVTLYAPGTSMNGLAAWASEDMFGVPTPSGGNLQLVSPFHETSFSFGASRRQGHAVVSLLQLFLDLARYPLRGPEGATMLVRSALGDQLGLTAEQRHRVTATLA
jgi:hypothetical protein